MEQPIPTWLTDDFLTHCLQSEDSKQDVVVINFNTSAAAPPGNNYGSIVLRVKVEYKNSKTNHESQFTSLIIKSEHTEGPIAEIFDLDSFCEPIFYHEFLPEAVKLMKTSFVAKSFHSPKFSVVVLEDLKEQGYLMADRTKQLDYDHCRLYVMAAASLHAVSVAVFKENPELVESIRKEKMFSNELKNADFFKIIIKNGFKCLVHNMKRIEKFIKYSTIINDTSKILWDMLGEAHQPSKVLNTINQGDPWTTNMMFKYDDDGTVSGIKLLDFQAVRHGSPINDLVFFIWSSANHDVKTYRLEELYEIYLDTFNNNLKQLNCSERLTYKDLKNNVKLLSPLAIYTVGSVLPIFFDPEPLNMKELFQDEDEAKGIENPYQKFYSEYYCNNHLPKLLDQLELAGVFEYLEGYKT